MKNNFIWNKESENSIYDAICDWSYYRFACIMKDGTLTEFTGMMDEDYEGHINVYIDNIDSLKAYSTDDIVMWIEMPDIEKEEKK